MVTERLLRVMSRAARDFDRARGKERIAALQRYVIALNDFTGHVLHRLPARRKRTQEVNSRYSRWKGMVRWKEQSGLPYLFIGERVVLSAGGAVVPSRRENRKSRPEAERKGSSIGWRQQLALHLSRYFGAAAADRILDSGNATGDDIFSTIEASVRMFLGKNAASQLARRMMDHPSNPSRCGGL